MSMYRSERVSKGKGDNMLMKELVTETNPPRKISHFNFGLFSGQDAMRVSHLNVVNRELFQLGDERLPTPNGCLDLRMGTTDRQSVCQTCGNQLKECAGHFGFVKLELPVFQIGYFKIVLSILQNICKTCSRIMMPEPDRRQVLKRLRACGEATLRKNILKGIIEKAKRQTLCPHCGALNGTVKKVGAMKIVHEVNKSRKEDSMQDFLDEFQRAVQINKDLPDLLPTKAQDDLNPLRVLNIFKRMTNEDIELLNMNAERSHPQNLILTHLLVPPVCIRPSIQMHTTSGSNEDDLTMKLTEIVHINQLIKAAIDKGAPIQMIMEDWDFLQLHTAMYINSELPGLPPSIQQTSKPLRSFCQRLKGKAGRFRGNLSGKRVDFSSRTVITPDPNIDIDEVAVPVHVAKILTYPSRVNKFNMERLRQCVRNGQDVHPGANFIQRADGSKKFLKYGLLDKLAKELRYGDIVERHLDDGDIVLFNRQPSLHKMSIMAHRVRVGPHRTFRLNECVCTPYNADFDGDEMNLHVPQTEEARAEALALLSVRRNIITPRNGMPLIAAIQDLITGAYLLTKKDKFLNRAEFSLTCSHFSNATERIDLPPPAILKPVQLWTGKQVFSKMLRPNAQSTLSCTYEAPGKNYSGTDKSMDTKDGYIVFRDCEHICGQLDKKALGSGSKGSIFYIVLRDNSPEDAADCMGRLARMCSRWFSNYGFSIGVNDVWPSAELETLKASLVKTGYDRCDEFIAQYKDGTLKPQPGCNAEETLEAKITGELSQIREDAGKMCLRELKRNNAPLIMALCGSKGSTINISQMVACVGQQTISGQRVPDGFVKRSLPHFDRGAREPPAKGFVRNSFFSGLTASEFFFHTMGGREGLVDTAVKTAETGYMQRRLMKALEDLSARYDFTVRNSEGGIIQFRYGDDGLDPTQMESKNRPVDFHRLASGIRAMGKRFGDDSILVPDEEWSPSGSDQSDEDFEPLLTVNEAPGLLEGRFMHRRIRALFETEELSFFSGRLFKKDLVKCCMGKQVRELSRLQFDMFLSEVGRKYRRSMVQPGEAVGAVTAQSIGEPATQMTLKTFHFAGVASMNVTLGVPRIKEIINAAKNISTPIITAQLITQGDVKAARIVKGRIEQTVLGEIAKYIKEVFKPSECYLEIKLDQDAIDTLQLEITSSTVAAALISAKLKLKPKHITTVPASNIVRVSPVDTSRAEMFYSLQSLKNALPKVVVCGIPGVTRAVINDAGNNTFNLLVEGCDLLTVMGTAGVKGTHTTCNHILENLRCLGIEAARASIMNEIKYTMESHGIHVDQRHLMLLADLMTFKGEVLGITRFGICKMKESVLMLASFEKTTDHLFEAAAYSRTDDIVGVSECIILGIPMPIGTGQFALLHDTMKKPIPPPESLLLDQREFHLDIL